MLVASSRKSTYVDLAVAGIAATAVMMRHGVNVKEVLQSWEQRWEVRRLFLARICDYSVGDGVVEFDERPGDAKAGDRDRRVSYVVRSTLTGDVGSRPRSELRKIMK